MEFPDDDFFGKLNSRLSFQILGRNGEDVVSVFVCIARSCEYSVIARELESVGFSVNSEGPSILIGLIAIKNLKALAALPYVVQIDGAQRLFTC